MIKGFITITTDVRLVVQQAPFCKIIAISADTNALEVMQQIKGINATILTPPYEAAVFDIEGDVQNFKMAYYQYLGSQLCNDFFALMFKAVEMGTNIILYLTPSEAELMYSKVLLEYLMNTFGLIIGTDPTHFKIIPGKEFNMYTAMLLNQLISAEEFLLEWKRYPMFVPSDIVIGTLGMMQRPYLGTQQPTFDMIKNYYLSLIKNTTRQVLPSAVSSSLIKSN